MINNLNVLDKLNIIDKLNLDYIPDLLYVVDKEYNINNLSKKYTAEEKIFLIYYVAGVYRVLFDFTDDFENACEIVNDHNLQNITLNLRMFMHSLDMKYLIFNKQQIDYINSELLDSFKSTRDAFLYSCSVHNQLHIVNWLLDKVDPFTTTRGVYIACKNNITDVWKLLSVKCRYNITTAFTTACENNSFIIADELLKLNIIDNNTINKIFIKVCMKGFFETAKILINHTSIDISFVDGITAFETSIYYSNFAIADLFEKNISIINLAMRTFAICCLNGSNTDLSRIKYLYEHFKFDNRLILRALHMIETKNNVEVKKYLKYIAELAN